MSTPAPDSRPLLRRASMPLTIVLVIAAVVLAILVVHEAKGESSDVARAGRTYALDSEMYGHDSTVLLPGLAVSLEVSDPIESVEQTALEDSYPSDRQLHDLLRAPDGGRLVPVTWQIRSSADGFDPPDKHPIGIRLVAGHTRIKLPTPALNSDARTVVVAVADKVSLSDLSVEVTFAGLTQTVHVASGRIDAGLAAPLYEPERDYQTGCADIDADCDLQITDRHSPVRPRSAGYTTSLLTYYPYDAALGWAKSGTLWVGVRATVYDLYDLVDADGGYRDVASTSRPTITLDGHKPVRYEDFRARDYGRDGRAVFSLAATSQPHRLSLAQTVTLKGTATPHRVSLGSTLTLTPAH